jgi:hypothetical protein
MIIDSLFEKLSYQHNCCDEYKDTGNYVVGKDFSSEDELDEERQEWKVI